MSRFSACLAVSLPLSCHWALVVPGILSCSSVSSLFFPMNLDVRGQSGHCKTEPDLIPGGRFASSRFQATSGERLVDFSGDGPQLIGLVAAVVQ